MSCLRAIGNFVSEFARFILFFVCIVFLFGSALLMAGAYFSRNEFMYTQLDKVHTVLSVVMGFGAYLILLALIGVFASFFSSKNSIKFLVLVTVLNVIVGLAVMIGSSPSFDSIDSDLLVKLKSLQNNYDWDHRNSSDAAINEATKAWDSIQVNLSCCGPVSSKDWAAFRPKGHESDNILPQSCCKSESNEQAGPYCDPKKSEVWSDGCVRSMSDTLRMIMGLVICMVSLSVVIGVLASFVLLCAPPDRVYSRTFMDM